MTDLQIYAGGFLSGVLFIVFFYDIWLKPNIFTSLRKCKRALDFYDHYLEYGEYLRQEDAKENTANHEHSDNMWH